MKAEFDNLRINIIRNFNQVAEKTDFSTMNETDLCEWQDFKNSLVALMAVYSEELGFTTLFDKIDIVDVLDDEQDIQEN